MIKLDFSAGAKEDQEESDEVIMDDSPDNVNEGGDDGDEAEMGVKLSFAGVVDRQNSCDGVGSPEENKEETDGSTLATEQTQDT